MYSEESVHERFSAHPPDANNADHFICVKYVSGQWMYDTGSSPYYYTFTPRTSDVLVAAINYTSDTITSLQGTNTTEYGIDKGYASGDLSYLADRWNGQVNDGEFSVQLACVGGECAPQGFTPHRLITIRKYYYMGASRIAMRSNEMLRYLFGDHLGSTSVVAKADGTQESERGYKPWGEQRFGSAGLTSYGFTGQKDANVAGGIMFYGARFFDQSLGRFLSADSIVPNPGNPMDYDRYVYVRNAPTKYTDPSGHCSGDPNDKSNPDHLCWQMYSDIQSTFGVILNDGSQWELNELSILLDALNGWLVAFDNDMTKFQAMFGGVHIIRTRISNPFARGMAPPGANTIYLYDGMFYKNNGRSQGDAIFEIIHELAHIFDFSRSDGDPTKYESQSFVDEFSSGCSPTFVGCNDVWFWNR